jgi:hypothetical protein
VSDAGKTEDLHVTNCPMLRLSDARFGDMCLLPSRAGELSQSEEKVELRAPYVGC